MPSRSRVLTGLSLAVALFAQSAAAATPAEQYLSVCALCHLPGIHGAPKVGDKTEWTRRLRSGFNTMYRNTIEGIPNTAMLPMGGSNLSVTEVRAVVDYMIAAAALPAAVLKDAARYDRLGITSPDFIRRDANFDGFLTRQELAGDALLIRNLSRFDTDRDGRLNESEYNHAEATLASDLAAITVDDIALESAVRNALSRVKGLDFQYARVEVKDGVVAIKGIVGHASVAIQAQDAVKRISGIKRIDNRLVSGDQMGWD